MDIRKQKLDEVEIKLIEAALYTIADAINALMRDGVPYTKVIVQRGGEQTATGQF